MQARSECVHRLRRPVAGNGRIPGDPHGPFHESAEIGLYKIATIGPCDTLSSRIVPRSWTSRRDTLKRPVRRLRAPATIDTCSERSPVSGDLFAFVAADSIAARFPRNSIFNWSWSGVRTMASMSPRSASVASHPADVELGTRVGILATRRYSRGDCGRAGGPSRWRSQPAVDSRRIHECVRRSSQLDGFGRVPPSWEE